jgi:formyl-CoA transferase
VIEKEWFRSGAERAKRADELDAIVGSWIGKRPLSEVVASFTAADAAVAPIFDVRDIFEDPQYQALQTIVDVPDSELGSLKMQNVIFRLSETPGQIRFAGRRKGEDNHSVYKELLGLDAEYLDDLAARGVI